MKLQQYKNKMHTCQRTISPISFIFSLAEPEHARTCAIECFRRTRLPDTWTSRSKPHCWHRLSLGLSQFSPFSLRRHKLQILKLFRKRTFPPPVQITHIAEDKSGLQQAYPALHFDQQFCPRGSRHFT